MGFNCGIVGLPNVGKSTIFNCLTEAKADAQNYPFCTIDPNVGVVKVPDPRLEKIAELIPPEKLIHATMEFVDIAGLVKGASKGEGLGNQFLANIRETKAIAHVVRCFEDPNTVHVEGSVDPVRDIEIIETELQLADLQTVDKRWSTATKQAKTGEKEAQKLVGVLGPVKEALEDGRSARSLELSSEDQEIIKDLHLITVKPVLYVCNVSEEDLAKEPHEVPFVASVKEWATRDGSGVLMICGKIEEELSQLEAEEKAEFLKDLGLQGSGLDRLIRAGYSLLKLITYFTAGEKEVRAWTIKKGFLAPQAAGVIHSDFERGFISAEIYHFEDLMKAGSELKIKELGLLRQEGKTYEVKDGDVILFRFNV